MINFDSYFKHDSSGYNPPRQERHGGRKRRDNAGHITTVIRKQKQKDKIAWKLKAIHLPISFSKTSLPRSYQQYHQTTDLKHMHIRYFLLKL